MGVLVPPEWKVEEYQANLRVELRKYQADPLASAVRDYLAADPLDGTAILSFLLAVEGL